MGILVFEIEPGRWAYHVGGVYQDWHPDFEGFVAMTQAQAQDCAEAVAARLG